MTVLLDVEKMAAKKRTIDKTKICERVTWVKGSLKGFLETFKLAKKKTLIDGSMILIVKKHPYQEIGDRKQREVEADRRASREASEGEYEERKGIESDARGD